MEILGLDMQRAYVNIFAPQNMVDIARDVAGDQFQFQGITYNAISATKWYGIDGWAQVLAIMVPQ